MNNQELAARRGGGVTAAAEVGTAIEAAPVLSRKATLLLAVACGLSVANVYYAQPLLDAMARDFGIDHGAAGMVVMATQIGCALALLFVVPLGDMLNRRRLIAAQLLLLALALTVVGLASGRAVFLAAMLAVGLLGTAMTQGLIALTVTLAAPEERGRAVGMAQAGVVIGLLLARVVAGLLADVAGWRSVYFVSALLALLMLLMLMRVVPAQVQAEQPALSYLQLLRSMFTLLAQEPVLQVRGVIAMLMFAVFNVFWAALVFPLSAPPHALSHTAIGAFGLVGVVGVLAAARAGTLADRGRGQWTTGVALMLLLASWLSIGFAGSSLWSLIVGIVLLDLAAQAIHVTNQSMIFSARPQAHSRLVGCYMLFYAVGSGAGAAASTFVYAQAGWSGVCLLGAGISAAALLFWALTLGKR